MLSFKIKEKLIVMRYLKNYLSLKIINAFYKVSIINHLSKKCLNLMLIQKTK